MEIDEMKLVIQALLNANKWWIENQDSPISALHHFSEAAKLAQEFLLKS